MENYNQHIKIKDKFHESPRRIEGKKNYLLKTIIFDIFEEEKLQN